MRNTIVVLGVVFALAVSSVAGAAITITGNADGVPTTDLDGFLTYTVTATTDVGTIIGFNFARSGGFGITGELNQLNPFGSASVFDDVPDALYVAGGGNRTQDSHFLVPSTAGIVLEPVEGADVLAGAFNFNNVNDATAAWAFLQTAQPAAAINSADGVFTVATPTGNVLEPASFLIGVPEPSTFAILGIALVGLGAFLRKR